MNIKFLGEFIKKKCLWGIFKTLYAYKNIIQIEQVAFMYLEVFVCICVCVCVYNI